VHFRHKTSDISETKRSRAKVTRVSTGTRVSIGDKSGYLAWPQTYVLKVVFSVLVSELINQEHIAVAASNLVEGLIMW